MEFFEFDGEFSEAFARTARQQDRRRRTTLQDVDLFFQDLTGETTSMAPAPPACHASVHTAADGPAGDIARPRLGATHIRRHRTAGRVSRTQSARRLCRFDVDHRCAAGVEHIRRQRAIGSSRHQAVAR